MKVTTAGKLADTGAKHIGQRIEFPDFHGRTITGTLAAATAPVTAVYATVQVDGDHARAVFRNTPVKLLDVA